jgi:ribonuclease HI
MIEETETREWYPENPPEFETAGAFQAWITGTDRPPALGKQGPSAAAWQIQRVGETTPSLGVAVSEGPKSEEYRAFVAAAVRAIEMLKPRSRVDIYCRNNTVVKAINEWLEKWESNGWKRKGGELKAKEIWQSFSRVKHSRCLSIFAHHTKKGECLDDYVFDELAERARRAADRLHKRP